MKLHHISLVTYAKPEQVAKILLEKSSQLQYAETAYHDKDTDKDPHSHINLWLVNPRDPQDLRKWFKACADHKDEIANTFVEPTHNAEGAHEYLTHKNQEGKYQYADEVIKVLAGKTEEYLESVTDEEEVRNRSQERARDREALREAQADDVEAQLQAIIDGTSHREMARRYGRDYIKNHKAYKEYALLMVVEETGELPDHLVCDPLQNLINKKCREATDYCTERTVSVLSALYGRAMQECGLADAIQNQVAKKIEKYLKGD